MPSMRLVVALFCLLVAVPSDVWAASAKPKKIEKRGAVATLQLLLKAAKAGNYAAVRPLLTNATFKGTSVAKMIIAGIKSNKRLGDFAYSHRALSLILSKHKHRFVKPGAKMLPKIRREFGRLIPALKHVDADAMRVFHYKNAFIFLSLLDGQAKLVFWEDLNRIVP